MSRSWAFPVLIAGLLAVLIAILGATIAEIGPWYRGLAQPRWAPPEAAFGLGWTLAYACNAVAGVTAWRAMPTTRDADWLVGLFALTGFLDLLWSLLMFRLHRPDWSLIEVVGLWVSVLVLMVFIWRRTILGAVLLLPYLGWVTFAGYLNMAIVRLNGPFS